MSRAILLLCVLTVLSMGLARPAHAVYSTQTVVWSQSQHKFVQVRQWHLFHPHPVRRLINKL
jgi:hypothetical protein